MFSNIISRFRYLTLIAVIVLAYIFYRSYFLFIFIVFLLVFPLISLVFLYMTKGKLEISIDCPARVTKGADISVTVTINNPSFFPVIQSQLSLVAESGFYPGGPSHQLFCGIPARDRSEIKFDMKAEYSGNLRLSVTSFRYWDFTGMFDIKTLQSVTKDMTVLPIANQIEESLSMVGGAGLVEFSEQDVKGNDSSMVIDTRDYQPGDKLQRIHWKLSTKLDKLLVKEYGAMSSQDVMLIVELTHGSFEKVKKSDVHLKNRQSFDAIFDTFFTISEKLLSEKRPFITGWYSPASAELKTMEITSREAVIEALTMMYYEQPSTVSNALELAKAVLDDYGDFLYIRPCLPKGLYDDKNTKDVVYEHKLSSGEAGAIVALISNS